MTDIPVLGAYRYAGCNDHVRTDTYITHLLGALRGGRNGNDVLRVKISLGGIFFRNDLHLSTCNAVVGKPRKCHLRLRVTVDGGNHIIWIFLAS